MKIGGSKRTAITTQVIDLVLGHPQLEIARQFKSNSHRPVVSHRLHRSGVTDLRDVSAKDEFWFEEKKQMPSGRAAQRLNLKISAEEIAAVRGALGGSSAGAGGLREYAPAEVGLVVRRGHLEIGEAANPVLGEKSAGGRCLCRMFAGTGFLADRLRESHGNEND